MEGYTWSKQIWPFCKMTCQSWFHFMHVEYAIFVHRKTHCRQKLAEGRVRLLGGKPGDRSLGLPGNLVGFMPQSTRWCPPCHSPPGSLWGSEWGGGWGWGVSSSSHNQLLLLLKTKDYNEKHELFAASSWNSPSQKRSPTLGDSYTWPEIRWWLCAHSHDSLNIILKGWEQKRKTAATAPPSRGRSSGMGQQISQCFYNW